MNVWGRAPGSVKTTGTTVRSHYVAPPTSSPLRYRGARQGGVDAWSEENRALEAFIDAE
jgi:hypothetical protein